MFNTKLFLCILVLQICKQVSCKECSDCMSYISCKAAADHALYKKDDETKKLFEKAFCGFVSTPSGEVPKVCCSEFPALAETSPSLFSRNAEDRSDKEYLLPEQCGHIYGDRIVGGTVAKMYEFPWMALISYKNNDGLHFGCGGTIINSRYILTAAHCVINKIAGVRVGEYNLSTDEDCEVGPSSIICEDHIQDIFVEEIIPHERFQSTLPVMNDIALLRVKDPIDFGFTNVAPICLPTSTELRNKNLTHRMGTVAGWGITETGSESAILLKVDVPIKSTAQCRSFYNRNAAPNVDRVENQFCAGEMKKDSCSGDSGGPLMLQEDYINVNRYVQYGIVSHGPQQCGSLFPGVYTDVRKFIDWILKNIRE